MIKRLRLATRRQGLSFAAFSAAWPSAVAQAIQAPLGVRPSRVAVCTTLPDLTGPAARHDGIGIEWFTDVGHLQRFQAWLGTSAGRGSHEQADTVADREASPVIVADEAVLRGASWLEGRWRCGGEKLKHMAIALRASELTPAEFSARWRARSGQVRRAGAVEATVIPHSVRGHAYVQNHPRPRTAGEWAYDAVNEVYFDDTESLRTRIEWFRVNLGGHTEEDLVRHSWFLAVREEVLA